MKNLKLFLIAFFGMVAWNCTNPSLEFEEEDFSSSIFFAYSHILPFLHPMQYGFSDLQKAGWSYCLSLLP